MTDKDIVFNLRKLFGDTHTPGQAFDALMDLRRAGVTWEAACQAIMTHGRARVVLDEADGEAFECPHCGVSRTNPNYCAVPTCPDYRPNAETAMIERLQRRARRDSSGAEADPKFKNPVFSFGKCRGKTILQAVAIDPGYVQQLTHDPGVSAFWHEQAKLAIVAAAALAPYNKDTDHTGYFD